MGTNYYLHEKTCEHCGRGDEPLHIGKSSAGWCFALQVLPDEGLNTLEDWKARWSKPGCVIRNEYGETVSVDELLKTITERAWPRGTDHRTPEYLRQNNAVVGPKGLMRHAIGRWCVGHGEGTWDYLPGDFS
jgi:hypothetical protein